MSAMGTLLYASFCRLVRDPAYRMAVLLTVAGSVWICCINYSPVVQASQWYLKLEDVFYTFLLLSGFLFAGCIALMQGAAYEYGTLRNLFVAGYTRLEIYAAALVTTCVGVLVLHVLHAAITVPLGYALLGHCDIPLLLLAGFPAVLLTGVSYGAICTCISMNCSSRSLSAVSCMGLVLLFGMLPGPERQRALQPLWALVQDVTPTGQLLQMYELRFDELAKWMGLSVLLTAVVSTVGWRLFEEKEIC